MSSEILLPVLAEYESIESIRTNFEEPLDELIKSLNWVDGYRIQTYKGHLVNSSLHGQGHYVWGQNVLRPLSELLLTNTYEGTFYASGKEGYGLLSCKDGSSFEGLFKNGHPFGPGVFTDSQGKQNVGIWRTSRLYRIYVPVEGVPKIATSSAAKIKLMKYRRLVPEVEEHGRGVCKDFTRLVLTQMGAPEMLVNKGFSKLFNPDARSPKSLFFNQYLYDNKYYNEPESDKDEELISKVEASNSESLSHSVEEAEVEEKSKESAETVQEKPTPSTIHLVAWNNESFMIDVLSHVYKNRQFESSLTYDIGSLVTGQRTLWRSHGDHEEITLSFLKAATIGNLEEIRRIITFFAIDENVTDARGNNAVHLAAAGDFHDLIKYLAKEGVSVDQMNDEGLTPLNVCIARYLAVQNRVANWEHAFLPPASESGPRPATADVGRPLEWNLRTSTSDCRLDESELDDDAAMEIFMAQLAKAGGKLTADLVPPVRKYLLSLRPLLVLPEKSAGDDVKSKGGAGKGKKDKKGGEKTDKKEKKSKKGEKDGKEKKDKKSKKTEEPDEDDGSKKKGEGKEEAEEVVDPDALTAEELGRLANIERTIDVLLAAGADPNVGQTPLPPLVLSLFARNLALTEKLLERGAYAKAATVGYGFDLTPLHVVCLMKPAVENASLARLLLSYGADPHATASPGFDVTTEQLLLTGLDAAEPAVAGRGPTPLHALSLRPDARHAPQTLAHLAALVRELAPLHVRHYLGHSPLSLAAYRNNADTVAGLLATGQFDPDEKLGLGLGNALAVLASLRCFELVPLADRIKLCDVLVDHGADPLRQIDLGEGNFRGNIVDFCSAEIRNETNRQPNPKKLAADVSARLKEYKKLAVGLAGRAKERMLRQVNARVAEALVESVKAAEAAEAAEAATTLAEATKGAGATAGAAAGATTALGAGSTKADGASQPNIPGGNVRKFANLLTEAELVKCLVPLVESGRVHVSAAEASRMLEAVAAENQARKEWAGPSTDEILAYLAPLLRRGEEGDGTGAEPPPPQYTRAAPPFFAPPELEAAAAACFECGRSDLPLETCPRCGVVAFCSKACNKANLARRGPNMHRCAIAFVGVKDPAAVAPVWGQLWKKAKGKKKEKEKKKAKTTGLSPKTEFFKSLEFDDGINYDDLPDEKVAAKIGEELEVKTVDFAGGQPVEVASENAAETNVPAENNAKVSGSTFKNTGFRDYDDRRLYSRRHWSNVVDDKVRRELLRVSMVLSKHSSTTTSRSVSLARDSGAIGRQVFPCSSESVANGNLQAKPSKGDRAGGRIAQKHSQGQEGGAVATHSGSTTDSDTLQPENVGKPAAPNLFMETGMALDLFSLGMDGNIFQGKTAAARKSKNAPGIEENDTDNKRNQKTDLSEKRPKRKNIFGGQGQATTDQRYTTQIATTNVTNRVNKFESKFNKGNGRVNNGKVMICQVVEDNDGRQGGTRNKNTVKYFPVESMNALLRLGDGCMDPDMFFLPYTVYKDGNLYYLIRDDSCLSVINDNSSLV